MTFQSNGPVANENYSIATGANSSGPFITVLMTRDPTQFDFQYPVKQRWINTTDSKEWVLTGFSNVTGRTLATWMQLLGDNAVNEIGLPAPSGNGVNVIPDANGLINFTSTANTTGSIAFTGSNGGVGAQNINFEIANFGTSSTLWVPQLTISGNAAGITYATPPKGGYTVLTNVVFIWAAIFLSSKGGNAGVVQISNLPFSTGPNGGSQAISIPSYNVVTAAGYTSVSLNFAASSTTASFLMQSASGSIEALMLDSNIANNTYFRFNGFYILN